jgi:hypothetical protein
MKLGRSRQAWAVGGALVAVWCAGCGGRGYDRYIPAAAAAREALEAGLASWQAGLPPSKITDRSPAVEVVDPHRRPGQRLKRYEVVGEAGGDGPRCFTVRLTLDNPPEDKKVRYCVMGLDPLWVFRQDDYEMFSHWECAEPEKKPDGKAKGPAE